MTSTEPQIFSVLLVEDDHGDAVLVQEALAQAGFGPDAITWARTLKDASRVLSAQPRCILLDLGLPDAAGIDVVRTIVGRAPDVPVIVLTGRRDESGAEALGAGAQDYIVKDEISADLLGRSIRYAVERKRAQLTRQQLREAQLGTSEKSRLERGLLPTPLLLTDGVSCSSYYQPGRDHAVLGGDFYDVVELADGTIRAVIGDVMGHGPDEAAIGVHLRVAWRTLVLGGTPDSQVLPQLAALFAAETNGTAGFVTVCDATIDRAAQSLAVRVAGHPAPLVCADGKTTYVDVEVGPPLGVAPAEVAPERWAATGGWPETRAELRGGSSLILYTDGLLDAYAESSDANSIGIDELLHAVLVLAAGGGDVSSWIETMIGTAPGQSPDDTAVVVLTTKPTSQE
jgi:serine phosphatase RsbU (regulator of sigma subunit)